ncbi:hypothetical protein BJP34_11820 [Moorena producens PAL-8-15-08-1]|uniref:Uncharacterized protein n=1 Tax=Moorena producens PAL-8-15-08-1 TaxID=1458985 RepID=A0A1D8TR52_9CYAN|nr:hypothetical protein [Moorena producens]AOX00053.1 hypothetical protein BJP34_11820 [Moorena producens PAL-8-15-08-1]
MFPLPDVRNQALTELQTRAVVELYVETRSIPKTVEIAWDTTKTGRKDSIYKQAHALVTQLASLKAT